MDFKTLFLLTGFYLFFWPWHAAFGILVPQPGIKPMSMQWKPGFLTTGSPGEFQRLVSWLTFSTSLYSWHHFQFSGRPLWQWWSMASVMTLGVSFLLVMLVEKASYSPNPANKPLGGMWFLISCVFSMGRSGPDSPRWLFTSHLHPHPRSRASALVTVTLGRESFLHICWLCPVLLLWELKRKGFCCFLLVYYLFDY